MVDQRSLPVLVLGGDFGGGYLADLGADAEWGWYDLYLLVVLVCVVG
jgi:hypothetical protein